MWHMAYGAHQHLWSSHTLWYKLLSKQIQTFKVPVVKTLLATVLNILLAVVSRVCIKNSRDSISVDSALKQLQNDSHFVRLCLIYKQLQCLNTVTGTNCEVNFTSYSVYNNQLADKTVSFYSSFNVLFTDISFIKMAFANRSCHP